MCRLTTDSLKTVGFFDNSKSSLPVIEEVTKTVEINLNTRAIIFTNFGYILILMKRQGGST